MIKMDTLLPAGRASDPVLMGVSRGLAQVLEPLRQEELPDDLAELVRRLDRDGSAADE